MCKLDSSHDSDAHMTVYVASDMPEPNEAAYLAALQRLLVDVHRAQNGLDADLVHEPSRDGALL